MPNSKPPVLEEAPQELRRQSSLDLTPGSLRQVEIVLEDDRREAFGPGERVGGHFLRWAYTAAFERVHDVVVVQRAELVLETRVFVGGGHGVSDEIHDL